MLYRPGDTLIFGPESRGLPQHWLDEQADHVLKIPIRPEARSLNLANAAAIAVFEAVRQLDAGTRASSRSIDKLRWWKPATGDHRAKAPTARS